MLRSKEIQEQIRNKIVDIYQSGKGYKAISKALGLLRTSVRAIIHKWRKLGTVVNLSRSGWPTKITMQWRLIQEVIKEPRTTSKELQASLPSIKISVLDSTIRKRLSKNGIHGRVSRLKPLLTKKNTKAHLTFVKKISWLISRLLGKYSVDWWDKSWEGVCPITSGVKTNTAFYKKNTIPTVKQSGRVMVWGCFAASGPGRLAIIDGTMNSALYQKILKENVRPSVCDLKLKRTWGMQQDNDPKHTSKSTSEWLKKNKIKVLEWPNQSLDLNLIEMLCYDLKQSCSKTLQCGWIKTILQRRVGQNSSTVMWKTHCQLSQTLDCSCFCKVWHNQLLYLGGIYFFT